jgi:hypothetical protein
MVYKTLPGKIGEPAIGSPGCRPAAALPNSSEGRPKSVGEGGRGRVAHLGRDLHARSGLKSTLRWGSPEPVGSGRDIPGSGAVGFFLGAWLTRRARTRAEEGRESLGGSRPTCLRSSPRLPPNGSGGGSGQKDQRPVLAKARWRIHERATSSGRRFKAASSSPLLAGGTRVRRHRAVRRDTTPDGSGR